MVGIAKKWIKQWLHLAADTTDHLLYVGRKQGGLGIPRLQRAIPTQRANLLLGLSKSSDPVIRRYVAVAKTIDRTRETLEKLQLHTNKAGKVSWRKGELLGWKEQECQGRGIENFQLKASNTWLSNPKFFTEQELSAALKLRSNTYPTRTTVARYSNVDHLCRRCKTKPETAGHISGACPFVKGFRIRRHNAIVHSLAEEAKKHGVAGDV